MISKTSIISTLLLASVSLFAADAPKACYAVRGFQEERIQTAGCTSPVGLCTVAEMSGPLQGEARYTASAIIPSADTNTTGIVFVIGDSVVVDVKLKGKRGTLLIKNAAAYRTTGNGDLVDIQTILGGTGDFVGATGSLRISGNFNGATGFGTSEYQGEVCIPQK